MFGESVQLDGHSKWEMKIIQFIYLFKTIFQILSFEF